VVGYTKLSLWLQCQTLGARNADFVGRLCDVFPNGKSINICDGITRLCFEELPKDSRGAFRVGFSLYPVGVCV